MVLACESIFSRDKLGCQRKNFALVHKTKPEMYTAYLPSGASKMRFYLPLSYNLQMLLASGNGQAPMWDLRILDLL